MRVVFMGTPDFSVSALRAILSAGHKVVAVYSQPPRPAGRGKKERPSPVHEYAASLDIPVYTPLNFKEEAEREKFRALKPEVAVVVAYGLLLPQEILDIPKYGCLNIHASLLPRWRGAAPIQRAIMAGDHETGIGIMQMEAGLDTGPVHLEKRINIESYDTAGTLHDKLCILGAKAIVEVLDNLPQSTPTAQSEHGVTYAKKIDKSEAHINWSLPAETIKNHIHGLSPFPGAWCEVNEERLKIHGAEISDQTGTAGQMIGKPLIIACGDKALSITRAQRPGKGPMDINALMNGFALEIGAKFS
ncbi:MAG: methionyl-tRNA formyltransferase [Alphaproteobacteria bacterium]|nr:methionyl-tRNA formyltransferase [Alphaproteobacteria bacterium]HRW29169.1 methionyl-tRNA formyltransferase [Emcibacteraceae bacterium]